MKEDTSDADLIRNATSSPSRTERDKAARVLFFRYYDLFSRTISSTLMFFSIQGDDGYEKRTELEDHVAKQVFLDDPRSKLRLFDEQRASFATWMRQVVRNCIVDWLRKQGNRPLTSNGASAEELHIADLRPVIGESDNRSEGTRLVESLSRVIAELSEAQRSVTVLRLAPYRTLTREDLEAVAAVARCSHKEPRHKVEQLAARFISSEEYLAYWLAEQQLEEVLRTSRACQARVARLELSVGEIARKHRDDLDALLSLQRREIESLSIAAMRDHGLPVANEAQAIAVRGWLVALWLAAKTQGRLERLQERYRAASLPLPDYANIADFLGMTIKQVRNHWDAARRRLNAELSECG